VFEVKASFGVLDLQFSWDETCSGLEDSSDLLFQCLGPRDSLSLEGRFTRSSLVASIDALTVLSPGDDSVSIGPGFNDLTFWGFSLDSEDSDAASSLDEDGEVFLATFEDDLSLPHLTAVDETKGIEESLKISLDLLHTDAFLDDFPAKNLADGLRDGLDLGFSGVSNMMDVMAMPVYDTTLLVDLTDLLVDSNEIAGPEANCFAIGASIEPKFRSSSSLQESAFNRWFGHGGLASPCRAYEQ